MGEPGSETSLVATHFSICSALEKGMAERQYVIPVLILCNVLLSQYSLTFWRTFGKDWYRHRIITGLRGKCEWILPSEPLFFLEKFLLQYTYTVSDCFIQGFPQAHEFLKINKPWENEWVLVDSACLLTSGQSHICIRRCQIWSLIPSKHLCNQAKVQGMSGVAHV